MRHYQNICIKGRGFRQILSHCTEYMVINMQALKQISHGFQVLPSTHQHWLHTKMFKKCQQYNIKWKHKYSWTRIQTLVYPMYAALAPKQNSIHWSIKTKSRTSQRGSLASNCHFGLNELWRQDQHNIHKNGMAKAIPDWAPEYFLIVFND